MTLKIDERFFTFRLQCFEKLIADTQVTEFAFRCVVEKYFYDVCTNDEAMKFFGLAEQNDYQPEKFMKEIDFSPPQGIICFNNTALPVILI